MKCYKCGSPSYGSRVCVECLKDFTEMSKASFDYLQKKHGELSPDNIKVIQKEKIKLKKNME